MSKESRRAKRRNTNPNVDPYETLNQTYNTAAGVRKTSDFGKRLNPLYLTPGVYTTDYTTLRAMPRKGMALAIYNNGALASLTMGDGTTTVLTPGTADAVGRVGIALKPNDWTYVNTFTATHVITSAATALVYVIEDDTEIEIQPSPIIP